MWKLIFVASLLALADGAALVRFINTVPTRTSNPSVNAAATAASATGRLTGKPIAPAAGAASATPSYNLISDRVGLHYYTSALSTPSVVWTTLLETTDVPTGNSAPYYWFHAMPALRGYHALATGTNPATEAAATDKPLGTLVATENIIGAANPPVDQWDLYDQTRLRADGVGLYLSFAPGQYRLEAYGIISDATTAAANTADITANPVFTQNANKFTTSTSTFTFEDNKVYTLIAYGDAAFGATVAYTGANVKLTLLTEDVTSTTFGMASLRFFHGIQSEAANSIDIYNGDIFAVNKKIASGIAFGSVSSYVDVAPSLSAELQVAVPGATVRAAATGTPVKREIRAGSRLTVICAQNNIVSSATSNPVFCRGIPSRAVAYVRLVNDVSSQNSVVQGKFFPQKLSATPLSLWASYELPRGDQVYEQSQVIGNSVFTNHPATTEGLYPVISNVAAGVISGYGEVFVPLPIMDFAIRWNILASFDYTDTWAAGVGTAKTAGKSSANPKAVPLSQFWFAPVHKRVHFVLKTEGGATLSGISSTLRVVNPFVKPTATARGFAATDSLTETPAFAGTVDEYLEPGQYYSLFVFPAKQYSTDDTDLTKMYKTSLTLPVTAYQDPAIIRIGIRLDHTMLVDSTTGLPTGIPKAITSGNGLLAFVPFFLQEKTDGSAYNYQLPTASSVTLTKGTTTITNDMTTYGKNRVYVARSVGGNPLALATAASNEAATFASGSVDANANADRYGDAAYISVPSGTYTVSQTLTTPANADCFIVIPAGGSVTIADQGVTEVFVLNVFGCLENSGDRSQLKFVTATRSSAATTGHSPVTKRSIETEVAVPLYNSAAVNGSSFLLALAALVLAMFAF